MSRRNYPSNSLAPPRKSQPRRRALPMGPRPITPRPNTPPQNGDTSVFRIAQLEGDNYRLLREGMAWEGAVNRRNVRIGRLEQELASTRQDLELTQRENTRVTSRNQELERRLKSMEIAHEKRLKAMEVAHEKRIKAMVLSHEKLIKAMEDAHEKRIKAMKERDAQHKAELDLLREQLTQQKTRHDTTSEAFSQIWSIMNQNFCKGVSVKEEVQEEAQETN